MKWLQVSMTAAVLFACSGTVLAQEGADYSVTQVGSKKTLTVATGDAIFEETLTPATFEFSITASGDVLRMAGDQSGAVEVVRRGEKLKVQMATATGEQMNEVRDLLQGSAAALALRDLADAARAAGSRYAPLLHSAHALLQIVQGRTRATAEFATAMQAPRTGFISAAQTRSGADACWDGYARSVLRYTYEYEGCIREARDRWWEVWRVAWCAYEYDLKATLAGYWLLDCSGFPV